MRCSFPRFRRLLLLFGFVLASLLAPTQSRAHEIPADVTIRAFVKPEGDRLQFLVRVPLESMRDIAFPLQGPGYLVIDQVDPLLYTGARMWITDFLRIYEDGEWLRNPEIVAARVSLPSNRSFSSYDEALAHLYGPPLSPATELYWQQAMMDVLIEYPIRSDESRFSIESELAHLGMRTTTILHFLPPDGSERVFQYIGDPGLVRLQPQWYHAAFTFVKLGYDHILEGIDHLLFVFLLVIPVRRLRPLVAIITSFTVAHSVTLIASAMGMAPNALWFPPLIEMLIAASIVFMAFENIVGAKLQRRWLIAFGFGLVHGFGFSFQLRESLQFAGSHLLTSLLAFNVGVELGQILVVLISVPILTLIYRHLVEERMGVTILSVIIAHSAWHWMADRWADFSQFQIQAPVLDLAFLALTLRWVMLLLILGGAVWLMSGVFDRLLASEAGAGGGQSAETPPGRSGGGGRPAKVLIES